MLELTAKLKATPFKLTLDDDSVVELKATEFTIGDITRLVELQKPIFENAGEGNLVKVNPIMFTRVMCSVKYAETGEYYWPGDLADFESNQYPKGMLDSLIGVVSTLNPVPTGEDTLDSKKNNS